MNIELFEHKSGALEPISLIPSGSLDYAFVPDALPPQDYELDKETWTLLTEAYGRVLELNGACQHLPNPALLILPLQHQEAMTSSKLEGTIATPIEFLFAGFADSDDDDPATDARNYYAALRQGYELLKDGEPIDRKLMKKLHRTLMRNKARGSEKKPGEFRERQNHIGQTSDTLQFNPPPARQMEICLAELEEYLAGRHDRNHALVQAFLAHYQFETIHPFYDGNGRVGRLILSLCIWKWLDLSLPWLYMSEYFYKTKPQYKRHLFNISALSEWDEWIRYCLQGVVQQASNSINRIEKLNSLRIKYKRLVRGQKRLNEIVEELFAHPAIRYTGIAKRFNIHYATARSDVTKLEKLGIVVQTAAQPKTLVAHEIIDIAFGNEDLDLR